MKKIIFVLIFLCSIASSLIFTGCKNKPNDDLTIMDTATIVIDLDSIVLMPFLPWDAMVADLEYHMQTNCSDWDVENPDSLIYDKGTGRWKRTFKKGNLYNTYYFEDAKGNFLKHVTFLYYGSMPFEPLVEEVERNGFVYQGDLVVPDNDSKIYHLYLSPSGALEVQVAGWENGSWVLSFQPIDPNDLQYLVEKKNRKDKK